MAIQSPYLVAKKFCLKLVNELIFKAFRVNIQQKTKIN